MNFSQLHRSNLNQLSSNNISASESNDATLKNKALNAVNLASRQASNSLPSVTADQTFSSSSDNPEQNAEAAARSALISRILTSEAAERLARIRLVRAQRAQLVEDQIFMLIRTGRINPAERINEEQLKAILLAIDNSLSKPSNSSNTIGALSSNNLSSDSIIISRRKNWDDDELDLDNL